MRSHITLVSLVALVCYVTAAPPVGRRPWLFRGPNPIPPAPHRPHHGGHHGVPRSVVCKFNSTKLDVNYDEPCDLSEYFVCVEGRPPHHGPSFGHHPGHEGPMFGGGPIFGGQPVFDRNSFPGPYPGERPHHDAEMGFCQQKNCSSDNECGKFSCVDGKCNITKEVRMYAAACSVTDEYGDLVKERKCLGECGTTGRNIIYQGKNVTTYFCRHPHNDDEWFINIMDTLEDWGNLVDIWFEESRPHEGDGLTEEDGGGEDGESSNFPEHGVSVPGGQPGHSPFADHPQRPTTQVPLTDKD